MCIRDRVADRRIHEALFVVRRRLAEAALNDHAGALARAAVTGGAEYVELLLPARHHLIRDRHRDLGGELPSNLPGIEVLVLTQLAAGDGVGHERPRGVSV